ncbi:hypothetical protein AADZ91_16655 [Colwelliaceae bacterium 6441]
MQEKSKLEDKLKGIMSWVAVLSVFIFSLLFFGRIIFLAITEEYWKKLGLTHFPSLVGLPAAAIASIFIVLVLRTIAGPLNFKAMGVEFSGASGPTILWVICFLSITLAIKLTWPLQYVAQ